MSAELEGSGLLRPTWAVLNDLKRTLLEKLESLEKERDTLKESQYAARFYDSIADDINRDISGLLDDVADIGAMEEIRQKMVRRNATRRMCANERYRMLNLSMINLESHGDDNLQIPALARFHLNIQHVIWYAKFADSLRR